MRFGAAQDTIITHSYTPIERGSIAERVKRRVAQMRSAEDIAATVEAQLFERRPTRPRAVPSASASIR